MAEPKPDPLEDVDDPNLRRALTRFRTTFEANVQANGPPAPEPQPPAKIIQFPLWPEPIRGMPNPILRSALFSAVQGKDRRFLDNELIAAVDGIQIRFTGKQLNQEDLEVCAEVFHLGRTHPLGDTCHTAAHGLLKALGRHTGNSQHRQLHQSLLRLQAHGVEIKTGRYTYFGSVIMEGVKDELTRHYLIKINPKLAPLFDQGWTGLEAWQRRRLRGKPLALWLHAFYATHAQPYPYKVATLRTLCGSRDKTIRSFRQKLRRARADLTVTGAIVEWTIEAGDLVVVSKTTSAAIRPPRTRRRPRQLATIVGQIANAQARKTLGKPRK